IGEIAVVNLRQFLPGAALRDDVAGGIPNRQSDENLTVVFADHAWDLAGLRNALAHPAAFSNKTPRGNASSNPDERSDIRVMLLRERSRISRRLRGGHPGYGYCSPGRAATISHLPC